MFDLNKINVMGSVVDMLSRFILLGFCHLYWEMEEGVYSIQLMMNLEMIVRQTTEGSIAFKILKDRV